ncbi:MAG TPA: pilus assembly protein [Chloroflexi bacterium]|nr:pilus assembly protein [Chloroflexota bacterium]
MEKPPQTTSTVAERAAETRRRSLGQSMVETAVMLPILLILIAGIVEIGALGNEYMIFHDAAREAARFGANLDPELTSKYPFDAHNPDDPFPDVRSMSPVQLQQMCQEGDTTNFYYEVACLAYQNLPLGRLDWVGNEDDIVITVVGVKDGRIVQRWPLPAHKNPLDRAYHFMGADDGDANPTCTITNTENCRCWSFFGVRHSEFDNETLNQRLLEEAPATAYVIVEIFHAVPQFTGLFTIGDVIPDPIPTRPYAIFPVSAAEPK